MGIVSGSSVTYVFAQTYQINVDSSIPANSLSLNKTKAFEGDKIIISANVGYNIKNILVKDSQGNVISQSANFVMPADNVTIYGTVEKALAPEVNNVNDENVLTNTVVNAEVKNENEALSNVSDDKSAVASEKKAGPKTVDTIQIVCILIISLIATNVLISLKKHNKR